MKYRAHKGGIELFRAYTERRTADKERNEERERQIMERLNTPFIGIPFNEHEELTRELLQMHIMKELDPVIQDLLKICESQLKPTPPNELLVKLRNTLRIGLGHAPSDSARAEKQWEIEGLWIKAYLDMETTRIFRSESAIAEEIAKAVGMSKATVINCWNDLKEREPQQLEFAKNIANTIKTIRWSKRAHDAKTKPTVKKKRPEFKF